MQILLQAYIFTVTGQESRGLLVVLKYSMLPICRNAFGKGNLVVVPDDVGVGHSGTGRSWSRRRNRQGSSIR